MDAIRVVADTLDEMEEDLVEALGGLSPEELSWTPSKGTNSIGFTFWHVTRAEDVWINRYAQGGPELFERGGWAARWGIPVADTGAGYDEAQVAAFSTPPVKELNQFYRAMRLETQHYMKGLSPEALDQLLKVPSPRRPGYTVGRMFGHLMSEIGQHVGHIRYLRGLQRGLEK